MWLADELVLTWLELNGELDDIVEMMVVRSVTSPSIRIAKRVPSPRCWRTGR